MNSNWNGSVSPGSPGGIWGWRNFGRLRANRMEWFEENCKQYGDLICFRVGPVKFFQVSHPDHVSELLVKHSLSLIKSRLVRWYFKRWMGEGLLLNEGTAWQEQRRKVRSALQQYPSESRGASVAQLAQKILTPDHAGQIDIAAAMDRLAFQLNVHALLGDDSLQYADDLYDAANAVHAAGIREISRLNVLPDWLPIPSKNRLRHAIQVFDDVLLPMVKQRRDTSAPASDLLSQLLVAEDRQRKSHGMSDKQVRDEAVNLMLGGKETVGAVLTWGSYLLSNHPDIQQRIAEEVGPWPSQRESTLDDLPHWPLVQRVILETMRLYPPVALLAREVVSPLEIGGVSMRRGDQVLIPIYAIHRDPRWYSNPAGFDAERFDSKSRTSMRQYTFIPFGAGPRSCVGKQWGFQQCLLTLGWLAANYELSPIAGLRPPEMEMDIVLHPRDPLTIHMTARDTESLMQRHVK